MLSKIGKNIKGIGLKILLLMFFVTSIVITKDNVKASSPYDFEYSNNSYINGYGEEIVNNVITKYNGTDINVEIPESIDGNIITGILNIFEGNNSIESVVIPNSVTSLGSFKDCINLKSVTLPEDITEIPGGLFYGCTSLESVMIPENVTEIGTYAFYGCTSLRSITIPSNVKEIQSFAFSECTNLEKITINANNVLIGKSCFYNCQNLDEVDCNGSAPKFKGNAFINTKIKTVEAGNNFRNLDIVTAIINPGTVEIPYDIFSGCENLKTLYINDPSFISFDSTTKGKNIRPLFGCNNLEEVVITSENPYYTVVDGIIYTKDMKKLVRCLPGKRGVVNIPNTVTTIGSYAFYCCKNLEGTLVIPDSVTELEAYSFSGCMSEIPIVLSSSLNKIEQCAFADSRFNGNLVIPDSVVHIDQMAFYNCQNFVGQLTLGNNVRIIDVAAFYNCDGLTGDLILPSSLNSISELAFASCEGLNGKVEYLGDNTIGMLQFAFAQDISLKEIKSNSPFNCGKWGEFLNCRSLQNVDHIGYTKNFSFAGCKNLVNINIDRLYGSDVLRGLENLEELRINNTTTELGRTVLAECPKLKTLYIPSSVTTIADNAFYKTENIQDIYVDNNRENISYAHILENVCKHVHYSNSRYTIQKLHNDDIEITDIESDYDEGYKAGSTYKFGVEPKLGYTINNLRVVLKIDDDESKEGFEIEKELSAVDGIYTIENVNRNMEIVVETNSSLINPNAESDS